MKYAYGIQHDCDVIALWQANSVCVYSHVHPVKGSVGSLLYKYMLMTECCISSYSYGLNLCRTDLPGDYSTWLYLAVGHLIVLVIIIIRLFV